MLVNQSQNRPSSFLTWSFLEINIVGGYQILLQYLLRNLNEQPDKSFLNDVDEVTDNFTKFNHKNVFLKLSASLRRYPSDKVLRLLWAYNQVQYEQPGLALDSKFSTEPLSQDWVLEFIFSISVWFRLMFPLIENRAYNQFVVESLSQLTT